MNLVRHFLDAEATAITAVLPILQGFWILRL